MSREYEYPKGSFRARCVKVVDGDTVDLHVDVGFHSFRQERFRLAGIDAPELSGRNADPEPAKESKAFVASQLQPGMGEAWPLRIETEKDPDNFGRYICRIFYKLGDDEVCLNDKLVEFGHAVYREY